MKEPTPGGVGVQDHTRRRDGIQPGQRGQHGQPDSAPPPHPGTALTFTTTRLLLSLMISLKLLDSPEEKAISLN